MFLKLGWIFSIWIEIASNRKVATHFKDWIQNFTLGTEKATLWPEMMLTNAKTLNLKAHLWQFWLSTSVIVIISDRWKAALQGTGNLKGPSLLGIRRRPKTWMDVEATKEKQLGRRSRVRILVPAKYSHLKTPLIIVTFLFFNVYKSLNQCIWEMYGLVVHIFKCEM